MYSYSLTEIGSCVSSSCSNRKAGDDRLSAPYSNLNSFNYLAKSRQSTSDASRD